MKKDDVLVSAELAKEKLISELAKVPVLTEGKHPWTALRHSLIELIRNTDLTDCQPPMEDCSVTQAQVPPSLSSSGTPLPALPMQKALTVVILRDDGAEEADACLAKLDKGGAFMVTKSEMFFHQLRLRAAEKPELLEKIDVFYLEDGEYKRCGLRYEDELHWPVGFLQDAYATEIKISAIRALPDQKD